MPDQTTTYDDLLSGEYWELYRMTDYDTDDEEYQPIGYMQAGVEFENDTEDWEANPSDAGVLQQFHGKSTIGLEFSGFVPHDTASADDNDQGYLVDMGLVTEEGVFYGKTEWEAAIIAVYADDPSIESLEVEPKQTIVCPSFGIAYENMEFPEDDGAMIDFNAHMNAYPLAPMMVGDEPRDFLLTDGGGETA